MNQQAIIESFSQLKFAPKFCFQSALFSASKSADDMMQRQVLRSYHGQEIAVLHCGLTQFDLAISIALKKIIKASGHLDRIQFTMKDLIQCTGKADGGRTRRLAAQSLYKNAGLHLEITRQQGGSFSGARINNLQEQQKGCYQIDFNQEYMYASYTNKDICEVDVEVFLSLPSGLISWFYGFMISAKHVNKIDLDLLHQLSGSNYRSVNDFKKAVKYVLQYLYRINSIGWRHGVTRDNIVYWQYNLKNESKPAACSHV